MVEQGRTDPKISKTKSVADLRLESRVANATRDHSESASCSSLIRDLNHDAEVQFCFRSRKYPGTTMPKQNKNFSAPARSRSLHNGMQKMMHSQSFVSAVGQEGARTSRLQSKRILTATSQSPCLFIIIFLPHSTIVTSPSVSLSLPSPVHHHGLLVALRSRCSRARA